MSRAASARRAAAAAAFGSGGLGLAAATGYAVLAGQARVARRVVGDPTGEPPAADGIYGGPGVTPIELAVLGDSSSVGIGVHLPDQTPGAMIAAGLARAARRPVRLTSAGRTGAMSADLADQVTRVLTARPTVAAIMIGANDVTHRIRPSTAVRHLAEAVRRLVEADCAVVVGTCPDLGTIEPIPHPLRLVARRWSRNLAAAQTVAVIEAGGRTVSLGDLLGPEFAAKPGELFSPDRFHPSPAGYARAVAAMLPSIVEAAGLPPAPSIDLAPYRPSRRDRVMPVSRAAANAASRAGSAVSGAEVGGSVRGPRGRWAFLRRARPTV